jgi:signal transduction histidine kinase
MDLLQELSRSLSNLNSGHSLPAVLQRMVAQKQREVKALVDINHALAGSFDCEALFSRVAAEAKTILGLDGVVLRVTREDAVIAASPSSTERCQENADGDSLSCLVASLNRPLAIKDISADQTLSRPCRELMTDLGWRSMLGAPLRTRDEAIGALVGCSRIEREFRPDEIDFISALADQAAIAAEKCILYEAAQTKTAEAQKLAGDLHQAHCAKAKFMSAVSHELRTPLQVIIGTADLLKDGIVGRTAEEQAHFLGAIANNAEALDGLIGNVLAVARSDAKQIRIEPSTVDVDEIMCNVLRYTTRINGNPRLQFSWDIEESLPSITTDAGKLEEILKHLVNNACKFTPEGRIDIRVATLKPRQRLEFTVADSGIGIDALDLDKIYEEFYQANPTQAAGMGLGLTIVKKYLDLMQGEISVVSRLGRGTTFSFTLPYSIG